MLGGAVVIAVGVAFFLPPLGVPNAGAYFFVALGAAFAAAYLWGARQYVYLVPAATFLGFGAGFLIPTWLNVPTDVAGAIFIAALACALGTVTLIAPDRRWPLVPAVGLGIVAAVGAVAQVSIIPSAFLVPAVLVLIGAYLLVEPSH